MPISQSPDKLLTGEATALTPGSTAHDLPDTEFPVIEVLEETVRVGKRLVETGHAKVHITVSERDEAIETLLMRQDLVVDRIRLDRPVEAAPPVRQEGDIIIVSLVEERVVVEKRLILTEELRIRIDQVQHLDTRTVRLRREQAEVDEHAVPTQPSTERLAK